MRWEQLKLILFSKPYLIFFYCNIGFTFKIFYISPKSKSTFP